MSRASVKRWKSPGRFAELPRNSENLPQRQRSAGILVERETRKNHIINEGRIQPKQDDLYKTKFIMFSANFNESYNIV